nr:MAG TPA: nucelotide kinase [Caudoviricetes sp.]
METEKKKWKEILDYLFNFVSNKEFTEIDKKYYFMQLDALQQEIAELEKVSNYIKASTTPIKKEGSKKEMVNHPLHYQGLEVNGTNVECIDAMEGLKGWFNTAIFCELNAFKYNWRVGEKDMIPQELGKIAWYGDKAKELWNKALRWVYPKNGHKYAIVNQGVTRMKNPTTKEWIDAIIYTDGKGFYVRDVSDFNKKFKLEE